MLIKFIITFILISSAIANHDKYLCGKKPKKINRNNQQKYLNKIANQMPPAKLQSPAKWCSAFTGTDHLDYHNYLNQKENGIKDPKKYYTPETLISPIEVVSATANFIHKYSHPLKTEPPEIDIKEGTIIFNLFNAIQEFPKLRSSYQIPFNSLEESNNDAIKVVEGLVKEYKKKHKTTNNNYSMISIQCPKKIYHDENFQEQINTFEIINKKLFDLAKNKKLSPSPHIIQNYESIAKSLHEKPSISVPPFIAHQYESKNSIKLLTKIQSVLDKGDGRPIHISICGTDFKNEKFTIADDCTPPFHSMSIVGAGYKDGKCIVKLRNTWGKHWNSDGHIDLTTEQLLKALNHTQTTPSISWITNEIKDETEFPDQIKGKRQEITKDNITFFGHRKLLFNKNGTYKITKKHGFTTKNGKKIKAHNISLENKNIYNGTVTNLDNGKWKPLSGLESKDGKKVYAHNYEDDDGENSEIYTGSIVNNRYDSVIIKQHNKIIRVRKQKLKDGTIYTGTVTDMGDNKWKPLSGLEYKDGKKVYAHNYKDDDGENSEIYTGSIVNNRYDSVIIKQHNKIIRVRKQKLKDGTIYTGTVTDMGDNKWKPLSGLEYKDGKIIHAYNYKNKENSEIYTGSIVDNEYDSGIIKEYNKITRVIKQKLNDGTSYTGTVTNKENEEWVPLKGKGYKNDELVYLYNNHYGEDGLKFYTGTVISDGKNITYTSGIITKDDSIIEVIRKKLENKTVYTGTVTDLSNGNWEPLRGRGYSNGKPVYLYNNYYDYNNDPLKFYTGTIITNGEKIKYGSGIITKNNLIIEVINQKFKKDTIYTGTVTNKENGEWVPLKGKGYKNGKLIYLYDINLTSPQGSYTGSVTNENNLKKGIITYPNGDKKNVLDGIITP